MRLQRFKDAFLDLVWPRTCADCREDMPQGAGEPLCRLCLDALVPLEPPFCMRCSNRVKRGRLLCRACEKGDFSCESIRAAFLYRGSARALVHAFKYRGRRGVARTAGCWMAGHSWRFPELPSPDALVPVPLHRRRFIERGYNQASLIAAALSKIMGAPVLDLLRRRLDTKPLWALGPRERDRALRGAFESRPAAKGLSVWIIDDVCTTAATLEGCARALKAEGSRRVDAYVFARQTT